jgi:glycosyltransferase involved in cell wall biosynthesis
MAAAHDASETLDVSIVLPVHNEVGHVQAELDRITESMNLSGLSYEIIVVDDGSTDGSADLLKEQKGIRLLEMPINRGSGHARKIGTRAARGEIVVWSDADMTYPNDRIPELVAELSPGYDQVVGARKTEEGTHRWARVPAKWFIRKLASYLVKTRIPDYLHMLPTGFSCVTTLTMSFLAHDHAIKYVPIDYAPRAGESKFHWRRDTARYILQVIRMIMTYNPLRFFLPLGGVLLLVASGKVVYDAVDKDFRITTNAIILTIVSFQVIAIGLLADLVARVAGPQD